MNGNKLRGTRKFLLAEQALLFSTVLAVLGILDGTQFVTAIGLVLGLYGGSNVLAKRNGTTP